MIKDGGDFFLYRNYVKASLHSYWLKTLLRTQRVVYCFCEVQSVHFLWPGIFRFLECPAEILE